MKKLRFMMAGIALLVAGVIQAQVSVNVHVGAPPLWAPAGVSEVRYYYLPDVEAYYDVESSVFIYNSRGTWVRRASLPGRYRNYDLYGGYKVVMNDYRGNSPYEHFRDHKMKYRRGYRGEEQRTIGERPGKGNPGFRKDRRGNHGGHEDARPGNNMRRGGEGNGNSRGDGNKRDHDRGGKGKRNK